MEVRERRFIEWHRHAKGTGKNISTHLPHTDIYVKVK
jgi:hypothetical protein